MRLSVLDVLAACDVEMSPSFAQQVVMAGKWGSAVNLQPNTRKVGEKLVLTGFTAEARGHRATDGKFIWISSYGLVARAQEASRAACEVKLDSALASVHFLPDTPHPVAVCAACLAESKILVNRKLGRFSRKGWEAEQRLMLHGKGERDRLPMPSAVESWGRAVWEVQPTGCDL